MKRQKSILEKWLEHSKYGYRGYMLFYKKECNVHHSKEFCNTNQIQYGSFVVDICLQSMQWMESSLSSQMYSVMEYYCWKLLVAGETEEYIHIRATKAF